MHCLAAGCGDGGVAVGVCAVGVCGKNFDAKTLLFFFWYEFKENKNNPKVFFKKLRFLTSVAKGGVG